MIGWRIRLLVGLCCGLGLLEGAARLGHVADTPLYRINDRVGYLPAPNQAGRFLWTHRWQFNELGMGTGRAFAPSPGAVLLVGDSIVFGGNPYRQEERLGPQLERAVARTVWPIAAGGWALQNELSYLLDHRFVVTSVEQLVIVLEPGDFGAAAPWRSDLKYPRAAPWSHALYALNRYVLQWEWPAAPVPIPPRDLEADFGDVVAAARNPILVVLYPARADIAARRTCDFVPGWLATHPRTHVLCIAQDRRWTAGHYRDGIHPTIEGTMVLGAIIADGLRALDATRGERAPTTPTPGNNDANRPEMPTADLPSSDRTDQQARGQPQSLR